MKTNVLGIVAGIVAGALIGVLFAPKKGSKTRNKIKNKTRDAKDNIEHGFDDLVNTASKKYNSIVHNGEEIVEKAKSKTKAKVNGTI